MSQKHTGGSNCWQNGGIKGNRCQVCEASNVTCLFKITHQQSKQSLLACRICIDNFWPRPDLPKLLDEVGQLAINDAWDNNRINGTWPLSFLGRI